MKKILYFIGGFVSCIILVISVAVIASINLNTATINDKFTEEDVKETEIIIDEFYAKKIRENFDDKTKATTIVYDVPKLIIEDADYKVEKEEAIFVYTLEMFNDCMNNGATKENCIERGKNIIIDKVYRAKIESMQDALKIQSDLNNIDHSSELKDGDFTITEEELNAK